ncbi:MAG: hypothetical protein ACRC30_08985 [Clostridium sp.]
MMDRDLILKLVDKKNSVILEDSIFYIINILEVIRGKIIKKEEIDEGSLNKSIEKIKNIKILLEEVLEGLKSTKVSGYTNSKIYLEKYLNDMVDVINKLTNNDDKIEKEELVLYTNILIDLALKY